MSQYDPEPLFVRADARDVSFLDTQSVDLIVTSPPYWKKRDYGHRHQIGQESSIPAYIAELISAMTAWQQVIKPTGSVIINVADSFLGGRLMGVPALLEQAASQAGWRLVNRIIWAKDYGLPEAHNRLAQRHEFILHFAFRPKHFVDLFAFSQAFGGGFNPGDVWRVHQSRSRSEHLAPFPIEIARRAITLACPEAICADCGAPLKRKIIRTTELNPNRPQAVRAMAKFIEAKLTPEHIAAIQAVGISDAGKALRTQFGAGRNSDRVKKLASEAKDALGGYFREFTFPIRKHVGWQPCACGCTKPSIPGLVLDPFMGSGTTVEAAVQLGRRVIGSDLKLPNTTASMGIPVSTRVTKLRK